MREICFDTETTGLNPAEGHRLIEIGCVEIINKIRTGNDLHFYINPQRDVPLEAYEIHGISTEDLLDKEKFGEVAERIIDFIGDAKLVAHNAPFDMKFINNELSLVGFERISNSQVIDTLKIAKSKFPGSSNSLDALCRRFNIDLTKRKKHGALLDAELLTEVYLELCGGAQGSIFSSFRGTPIVMNNKRNDHFKTGANNNFIAQMSQSIKKTFLKPRDKFNLTAQEDKNHQNFIKENIPNCIWDYKN